MSITLSRQIQRRIILHTSSCGWIWVFHIMYFYSFRTSENILITWFLWSDFNIPFKDLISDLGVGNAVQCCLWSKLPSVSKKGKERDTERKQKHVNIIVNILPLWLNQMHAECNNSERDLSSVVFLFFNTTEGCCGQWGEPSKPQRSSSVSYPYSHKLSNSLCALWFSMHLNVLMLLLWPEK